MEKIWDEFDRVLEDAHPEEKQFFHMVLVHMEDLTRNVVALQRALDLMCKSVEHAKEELKCNGAQDN